MLIEGRLVEDGRAVRIESFVNRRKALAALDDAGD